MAWALFVGEITYSIYCHNLFCVMTNYFDLKKNNSEIVWFDLNCFKSFNKENTCVQLNVLTGKLSTIQTNLKVGNGFWRLLNSIIVCQISLNTWTDRLCLWFIVVTSSMYNTISSFFSFSLSHYTCKVNYYYLLSIENSISECEENETGTRK